MALEHTTTTAPSSHELSERFFAWSDQLNGQLKPGEVLLTRVQAEESDFVRFNQARVRQATHVTQSLLGLQLIAEGRQAAAELTASGNAADDARAGSELLSNLRAMLPHLPPDPYLMYQTNPQSSVVHGADQLLPSSDIVDDILRAGDGLDLVGILASGGIFNGFASSLGQRNWFSTYSCNFDWSLYHQADKAVKSRYAGYGWASDAFALKMSNAREQLRVLAREPRTIAPGRYRVYLSPMAFSQYISMLSWGGFSLKETRSRSTPLLALVDGTRSLHPGITMLENTADGVAPNFQEQGFSRPARVPLIEAGRFHTPLASPRSAREYGMPTHGANADESPESLDVAAGDLPHEYVLRELGTGLYINNLWYMNFSDRASCRITGMTRFATFWVEDGEIVAPINVMRFDESLYRALGDNLIGLTREREMIMDARTFVRRNTLSVRVPGALIDDFTFTL